jgi:hypothetical protein
MSRFNPPNPCENLNHRRTDAPVGHCPECGGVVNARIRARPCSEAQHAAARRYQTVFCVDCGTRLIVAR